MLCSDGNQHRRCLLPRNSGDLQAMIFSYTVFVCLQTRSTFCAMIFQARKLRQLFDFHPILTLGKSKKKFLSLQTSRLLSSVKYFALLISFFSLSEIFFFPLSVFFQKNIRLDSIRSSILLKSNILSSELPEVVIHRCSIPFKWWRTL